jgi:hypothetical protein
MSGPVELASDPPEASVSAHRMFDVRNAACGYVFFK